MTVNTVAVRPPFAFMRPLAFMVFAVMSPLAERDVVDIPALAVTAPVARNVVDVSPPFAFMRPLALSVLAVISPLADRDVVDIPAFAVIRPVARNVVDVSPPFAFTRPLAFMFTVLMREQDSCPVLVNTHP